MRPLPMISLVALTMCIVPVTAMAQTPADPEIVSMRRAFDFLIGRWEVQSVQDTAGARPSRGQSYEFAQDLSGALISSRWHFDRGTPARTSSMPRTTRPSTTRRGSGPSTTSVRSPPSTGRGTSRTAAGTSPTPSPRTAPPGGSASGGSPWAGTRCAAISRTRWTGGRPGFRMSSRCAGCPAAEVAASLPRVRFRHSRTWRNWQTRRT